MKILLVVALLMSTCFITNAQCDKKFNLVANNVYQLNPDSTLGEAIPGKATIKLSKDSIHVVMAMDDGTSFEFKGLNKETICKMNSDYTNGRIDVVYDAILYARGNERNDKLYFTITSKDGSMKLVGSPESNRGDRICFEVGEKKEIK